MTTFDFDQIIERRGTSSLKWDKAAPDVLPLWVADMDFATAPCVQQAIVQRALHPCFGYVAVPSAYYDAIIAWHHNRHGWRIDRRDILYTSGVIPAIASLLRAVTLPGERVIVLTPVYNCFFSSIRNSGCEAVEVPVLARLGRAEALAAGSVTGGGASECKQPDAGSSAGIGAAATASVTATATASSEPSTEAYVHYEVDWERLEAAAADERTTVLLFCNPHNPTGHIWTQAEMEHVADICRRHGVFVISDEIHSELAHPALTYVPWATLPERVQPRYAVCCSASKAFNVAGLQNAYIVCPDPEVRRRTDRVINLHEVCDVGPFGVEALIAAYSDEGAAWLDQLRTYLWGNASAAHDLLTQRVPGLRLADLQATYLMWADVRDVLPEGMTSASVSRHLIARHRVWVTAGSVYGAAGEGHLRINLATPRARLIEGLERLVAGLEALAQGKERPIEI